MSVTQTLFPVKMDNVLQKKLELGNYFLENGTAFPPAVGADTVFLSMCLVQSRADEWTWILLLPWLKPVTRQTNSDVLPEQHYNVNNT